jgi:hypothetical protein
MNNNPDKQSILNQAQKDKFLMVLDVPPFLQKLKLGTEKEDIGITSLQLTIFGSVVPAASVPNVANGYSGQIQHITSMARPEFSPLTLNFVVDNRYHNYYLLWKWFAGLNDPKRSIYTVEPNNPKMRGLYDYQTNMTIFGLDEYNKKVIEFKYLHVFPIGLGGIEYSYQDTGGLVSNVTFQFDQLLIELVGGA